MEIALSKSLPTYSGGLGMLAGDSLRSAADCGVSLVAVSLVHRRGYFEQHLDAAGQQTESDVAWLRGQLVFDNAPLSRVRDDLRRWYGLELVIPDSSLLSRHVSTQFRPGESSAQVLRVLELALGATIERRGDTAIVRTARP